MTKISGEDALNLTMPSNDAEAETVRDYLKALLMHLWEEGEGFSGKRPFGNSGWEYDLYGALEQAGITDRTEQEQSIFKAIDALS